MIEIISRDENGNADEKMGTVILRLPKNVKQVGDVVEGKKIYIEDYVYNFIKALKKDSEEKPRQFGVLMGQVVNNGKEDYAFVRGAVVCDLGEDVSFGENVWNEVYNQTDKFFPEFEIVGWYGVISNLVPEDMKKFYQMHIDSFAGRMKSLFLIDVAEEKESFFMLGEKELEEQAGYIQFYERNREMQEYIAAVRGEVSCENTKDETVVKNFRSLIQEKQEDVYKKRSMSLAYGVGSFMVVVILIIGVNLMNSYEKMNELDMTLKNLVSQISNKTNVYQVSGNVYPTQEPVIVLPTEESSEANVEATEESSEATIKENPSQPPSEITAGNMSKTYIIKAGDSLVSICREKYGNTDMLEEIAEINSIENIDKIYAGQEIKLP